MKAREIMTPDPEVVTPEQPISRAAQIVRTYEVGIVPVVSDPDSRNLIGVITDRDIAVRHVADAHMEDCTVGTHMTRDDIETVEETDDTATVLAAMKRREGSPDSSHEQERQTPWSHRPSRHRRGEGHSQGRNRRRGQDGV